VSTYTLPDLPYDYAALEPAITGEVLELHHAEHHAAYVEGANDALGLLAGAREKAELAPTPIVGLEKTLAFNLSGHVLHSIFWRNLGPDGGDRPDGGLGTAIAEHFGSFDAFATQLTTATDRVREHAYHLQYRNVRPDCVARLWSLVDWQDVASRYAAARASRVSPIGGAAS
jgi:Fe-Mn family superoxide dismutase